jgi:hypothetical protein
LNIQQFWPMTRSTPSRAIPLALSLFLTASPPAFAQSASQQSAAAQTAFDEAMKLMSEGRTAEACPKFEAAQRLDPGMATQFRLAECYDKTGRLASAWANYVEVADAAKAAKSKDREAFARKRAAALEPRLSRLTIVVPQALSTLEGLEIKRDRTVVHKALWGTAVPVDPGEHVVVATAPGKKPWQGKGMAAEQPTRLEVTIPALEDMPPPPSPALPESPLNATPHQGGRSVVPAVIGAAAAVVAAGVGGALFAVAIGKQNDAVSVSDKIGLGRCTGPGATRADCADLESRALDADRFHNVSIGMFVGAGVLAAASLTYLLWPSPKTRPSPRQDIQIALAVGVGEGGMLVSCAF